MANNVKFKWFDIAGSTAAANINKINGVNDEDLLYVKSTTPGTGSNVVSLPYLLRTRGVNWYGAATPPFVAYTDGTNGFTTRPLVDVGGAALSILKDPTGDTGNYWSVTAFQENTGAQGFKIKINFLLNLTSSGFFNKLNAFRLYSSVFFSQIVSILK